MKSAPVQTQPTKPGVQPVAYEVPPVVPVPAAPSDVAAPSPGSEKTASGLVTKVLKPGTGTERVKAGEVFVISFTEWERTGKPMLHIDNAELNLDSLAPGWAEGVKLMAPGETRRLWIPAS